MAGLKKILLIDVQWWDTVSSTWKPVIAVSPQAGETAVPLSGQGAAKAQLYYNATPINMPTTLTQGINFANFEVDGSSDHNFSIFGASLGRIPLATKSPLLKYKIETTVFTTEDVVTTNSTYHYMMLNASFATNAFSGAGGTASASDTTANTTINFYFPGVTGTMTNTTVTAAQATLLQTKTNWEITVTRPDGSIRTLQPTTVTAGTPSTVTATDYGAAKILMTLVASISYPIDGNYTISVNFQSNDQDPAFAVLGSQVVVADVTVYTGSTQQYVVSADSDVSVTISFAG